MRQPALFAAVLMAFAAVLPCSIADTSAAGGSDETDRLRRRVAELETLVERLRAENAALRRQEPAEIRKLAGGGEEKKTSATGHWLSNTGKRHNARCRYFENTNGRPASAEEGTACKICGG